MLEKNKAAENVAEVSLEELLKVLERLEGRGDWRTPWGAGCFLGEKAYITRQVSEELCREVCLSPYTPLGVLYMARLMKEGEAWM